MRVLLVDGYNVLGAAGLMGGSNEALDAARARLVEEVAAYAASEWDAIVVFDGALNPRSDGAPHRTLGITVVFSPAERSADSVIEGLAREHALRGDEVVVVTSDAQTQWAVMRAGVGRMSSAEFVRQAAEVGGDWREHTPSGRTKARLEDHLDEATREKMFRWARGL